MWRRLPKSFRDRWDQWLDEGLRASRSTLADQWLESYLGAPLWRFALGPQAVDQQAWVGVLMPSVDSAGRYFPLTVAAPCGDAVSLVDCCEQLADWYAGIEAAMLKVLEDESMDVETFDGEVAKLSPEPVPNSARYAPGPGKDGSRDIPWASRAEFDDFRLLSANLLVRMAQSRLGVRGLWWTQGGAHIEPTLAFSQGLIPPEQFHSLLTGHFGPDALPRDRTEDEPGTGNPV